MYQYRHVMHLTATATKLPVCPPPPGGFHAQSPLYPRRSSGGASTTINLCLAMSLRIPPFFIPPTFTPFPIGTSTHECTYYSHKYKHSVRPAAKTTTVCPPPMGLSSCSTVFCITRVWSNNKTAYLDVSSPHSIAFYVTNTSKNEKPGHAYYDTT